MRARRAALVVIASVVLGVPARAQDEAPSKPADAPVTWTQAGRDARYVFGRPAHLDARGWTKLGVGVGIGGLLYLYRTEVRDWAARHADQAPTGFLYDMRYMSRSAAPLTAAGAFYLAGAARDSDYDKETASLLLENAAYSAVIAGTAQQVMVTERPRDGNAVVFFGSGNGHSVSGDATMAASLLAPIIERHLTVEPDDGTGKRFWKRFGAGFMYGAAGLVALQRIHVEAHWVTDVYFGYLNGLAVGRMLVDSRRGGRDWREARRAHRVDVAMTPTGITIRWP